MTNAGKKSETPNAQTNKATKDDRGFELDEDRPIGQNSAYSPQGGQHNTTVGEGQNPMDLEQTHIGKTQSTTNSQ